VDLAFLGLDEGAMAEQTAAAENVNLLNRKSRINPPAREVRVEFDVQGPLTPWPKEVSGTIVSGLTEAEARVLITSDRGQTKMYIKGRATRGGQARQYQLMELEEEAPGRFPFRARRDFDPDFSLPK
jgi:hypothetical protein